MTVLMNGSMYHSRRTAIRTNDSAGANFVLQPKFDPEGLLSLIEDHRVTST